MKPTEPQWNSALQAAFQQVCDLSPVLDSAQHLLVLDETAPVPGDELSAFNAFIHDRGVAWSKRARQIRFDIEFKAIEQERRRVAKDLHDEVLPSLARLIRSIQSARIEDVPAKADLQSATAAASDPAADIVDTLHTTVSAIRDLLGELHPVDLEELGLVAALDNACRRCARLTKRSVVFIEHGEECELSDLQQLGLYRAVQCALEMFAASDNDVLLISYHHVGARSIITGRCVDKRVSSAQWLSIEAPQFSAFESWCGMAGADVEITTGRLQFDHDFVISASQSPMSGKDLFTLIDEHSQIRLQELDNIVAVAQEEWANAIDRDCAFFRSLATQTERTRIMHDIKRAVLPQLDRVWKLSEESNNDSLRNNITRQMNLIAESVGSVLNELQPVVLAEKGLINSIKVLVDRFKRASLIETAIISNLETDQIDAQDSQLTMEEKFAIYRVVQEALNNIEKHSCASRVFLTVKLVQQQLSIHIEDNGKGFSEPKSTQSRGLKIIRDRAEEIGAEVTWRNAICFETGAMVTISMPC